jgi:glycosyltransferase involved in cell wall biosynthesis
MPGKLFEYMAVGLPVITSARKPVLRIVEQEKCGIVYDPPEPEIIAQTLIKMMENPRLLHEMGTRGRDAVLERYNQDINAAVLEKIIHSQD